MTFSRGMPEEEASKDSVEMCKLINLVQSRL